MINDEFAAVVHGEYRRHELLVAVMQQAPKSLRPHGFGSYQARSLLVRVQQLVKRTPRDAWRIARP